MEFVGPVAPPVAPPVATALVPRPLFDDDRPVGIAGRPPLFASRLRLGED
jgi:hypothetical protein